jgi:TIR domain
MDYEWDLFVSYRRQDSWTPWTRNYLKKELEAYLQPWLGSRPKIYVDDRSPGDPSSATTLGEALSRSKAMIAILSGDYWYSSWCVHELDLMFDRVGGKPDRIIATVVHDCEKLPPPAGLIKHTDFSDYRVTNMNVQSQLYQDFSIAVKKLAQPLSTLIQTSPAFDISWTAICVDRFTKVYAADQSSAVIAPKWVAPPAPPTFGALPRLSP